MKINSRKLIAWLLIVVLLVCAFPLSAVNVCADTAAMPLSENTSEQIKASIEQQIRAFADSIDKSGADDDAALALAKHGITGGGKKLSIGKSHALTATLMNSELLQLALIESCATAIEIMQNSGLKELNYVHGNVTWGLWEGSWGKTNYVVNKYSSSQYTVPNIEYEITSGLMFSSRANAYDRSLEWMASYAAISLSFRRVQVTNNEITYQVTCGVEDRFDFNTSQGSNFDKLISGLASLLFREFDWESKVNFQLQVPNGCSHLDKFTSKVTKPTCTAQGYTTYTCSACGYSYKGNYTKATGHSLGDWGTTVAPTCTAAGEEGRNCAKCSHYETREIKALGHNLAEHSAKSPTCTEIGWNAYETCLKCNYTTYLEIPAKEHNYKGIVTAPTCTEQGYTTYICTACGDTYIDSYVNANSHAMGEWTTTKAPTCTESGSERSDCLNCDHYETRVIDATGHSYKSIVTLPTCTEQGYTTHTCHCGDIYVDSYVDAKGHNFEKWVETIAPTCTGSGSERRDCSNCGHYETRVVDATGHNKGETLVENRVEPTCAADGSYDSVVYCTICNTELSREAKAIDALGHNLTNIEAKAPNCIEIGWEAYDKCQRCDYTTYTELTALGHKYNGVCDSSCNVCEAEREVPNHTYDNPFDAECNECGLAREVNTEPTLYKDTDGKWYYYVGGVKSNETTLVKYSGKWFYVKNGKWSTAITDTLIKHEGKWFYIKNGKWDKSVTETLVKYKDKWFYIKNGKWDNTVKTICTFKGKKFYIKGGKAQLDYSGKVTVDGKKYTIKGGKVV